MKNLFCKIGLHKAEERYYVQVVKTHKNGKQYRRNYRFCKRCGKRMGLLSFKRTEDGRK